MSGLRSRTRDEGNTGPLHEADRWMLFTVLALLMGGLVMVYSTSGALADQRYGSPFYFVLRQGVWIVLGLIVMAVLSQIPYRVFRHPAVAFTLAVLVTVMLIAVLFESPINGSRRWIDFGFFNMQVSEIAKWALVPLLAAQLTRQADRLDSFKSYLVSFTLVGVYCALVAMEPDFGMVVLMVTVAAAMFFVAGMPWLYVSSMGLLASGVMAVLLTALPYRRARLFAFFNPESDPLGINFQIRQSLIAVGSGGVGGRGLGQGQQKLFFLPEPHTDFIFSATCEELGLVGALVLLSAFLVLLWRGVRTMWLAQDFFGALIAAGFTTAILAQAFFHMGVSLQLLPTKGTSLPFFSYGGSSILMNCAALGLLLNVSSHTRQTRQ